jgi:hypothetical protein
MTPSNKAGQMPMNRAFSRNISKSRGGLITPSLNGTISRLGKKKNSIITALDTSGDSTNFNPF